MTALKKMLARPEVTRARSERLKKSSERFDLMRYAQEIIEMLFSGPRRQTLRRVSA